MNFVMELPQSQIKYWSTMWKEDSWKIVKGNVDISWNVQWKTNQFFFCNAIWLNASLVAASLCLYLSVDRLFPMLLMFPLTIQMFQCLCHESNQNNEMKKIVCRQLRIRQQLSWLQHKNFIAWLLFFFLLFLVVYQQETWGKYQTQIINVDITLISV